MKRVLIVDDETLARARIRKYLDKDGSRFGIGEIHEAKDGFEAIERVPELKPDLIFLDIEMPELNGFDVLRHLQGYLSENPARVVFQTAYDEFAVKAFEVSAVDYLLKPFTDERLAQSLKRALGEGGAGPAASAPSPSGGPAVPGAQNEPLRALNDQLTRAKSYLERFVVKVGPRSKVIEQRDVLYFLSESHATRIFLSNVDYVYGQSLADLEMQLDPRVFLRIHRNCIVKLEQIASFTGLPHPSVTLKSGATLKVSRSSLRALKDALEGPAG